MKMKWLGIGFGAVMTLSGVVVPAVTAQADPAACYPLCTAPTQARHDPTPAPVTKAVVVSSSSLAFTGADIEEMTLFGAGALVVGGTLVRRSRRRRLPS
jgi:hypothetical protein